MNEYGTGQGYGSEIPDDEPVETVPEPPRDAPVTAETVADSEVKEMVKTESGADGDVLAKSATAEGVDQQTATGAAAEKIRNEVAQTHGDAAAQTAAAAEAAQGTEMGGYRAEHNDYSTLTPQETAAPDTTGEHNYPVDHPLAELWNGRDVEGAGDSRSGAPPPDASAAEGFQPAAKEVTEPASSKEEDEEGDPTRPVKSRYEYEIRPDIAGGTVVSNRRK